MNPNMDTSLIRRLGDELYAALRERRTLVPLTDRHPEIGINDVLIKVLRTGISTEDGKPVLRIVPDAEPAPNRVPCGPRSNSTWSISIKSIAVAAGRA